MGIALLLLSTVKYSQWFFTNYKHNYQVGDDDVGGACGVNGAEDEHV
jgi:hypothetical protein